MTESMAQRRRMEIVAGQAQTINRHPGSMPGNAFLRMKLVFEKQNGLLAGGQVAAGDAAAEIANIIAACIRARMTVDDVAVLQVGTHPMLTASPIAYPIMVAAEAAREKLVKR